jgi:hypothetical protein
MTWAEFEAVWDGRLVLMTKRAALTGPARRVDITWFLGAIHKYRRLLSEVLVASFFLQLCALDRSLAQSAGSRASIFTFTSTESCSSAAAKFAMSHCWLRLA